ncbi:hypothetical protein [Taklimakanibacter deserti]|uniref:hypothetical protein n=1 Tax=Taklimakanibacter deserti TaxID=2267839 RepID=UPI000E657674
MAIVEPGKGRAVIEHDGTGLRITIPAATQAFGVIFMGLWLTLWAVGELAAARQLWNDGLLQNPKAGLIIWFVAWTLGGGWMIYALLWQLVGKEVIELNSTSLKQVKQISLLSRSREYAVAKITNIRLAPPAPKYIRGKYVIQTQSFEAGAIAFDYGHSTCHLGQGLDEADARHVISEMRKRVTSLSVSGNDSKQELETS